MAIIRNIVYPHVGIKTNARTRATVLAQESTATVLFAPFKANRGPENVVKKVYSNSELLTTYGTMKYSEQGQQVLNIGNWLNSGGAVLACRMTRVPLSWYSVTENEYKNKVYTKATTNTGYLGSLREDGYIYVNGIKTIKAKVYEIALSGGTGGTIDLNKFQSTVNLFEVQYGSLSNSVSDLDFTPLTFDANGYLQYNYVSTVDDTNGYKAIKGTEQVLAGGKSIHITDIMFITAYGYKYETKTGKVTQKDEDGKDVQVDKTYNMSWNIVAKYSGAYYNTLKVVVQKQTASLFKLIVTLDGTQVESYSRRSSESYKSIVNESDYVGEIYISDDYFEWFKHQAIGSSVTLETTSGTGVDTEFDESMIPEIMDSVLADKLSVKFDIMLDAGYTAATKQAITKRLASSQDNERVRDDVIFISDLYELTYEVDSNGKVEYTNRMPVASNGIDKSGIEGRCVAVYDQYGTTEDIYSEGTSREVYVTPTYFLAGLIPYNDATYGVGYPVAGKRRGVIEDAISINHNPTPAEKNEYYESRINYIEKDSRTMQFMSQSTYTDENTALQYLNNSRVVNKMITEVEALGRDYLFEQNDATTLNNLKNAILKYLNNWVLQRVLTKANVSVEPGEDDKIVNIKMDIAFVGIIEIISIEINID